MNFEIFIPTKNNHACVQIRKRKNIVLYFSPAFLRCYIGEKRKIALMWNNTERKIKVSFCNESNMKISVSGNKKYPFASIALSNFIKHFEIIDIPHDKDLMFSVMPGSGDIIISLNKPYCQQ